MHYTVWPAGYFHAPGALLCPLGKTAHQHYQPGPPLPSVCVVFCAVEDLEAMQVIGPSLHIHWPDGALHVMVQMWLKSIWQAPFHAGPYVAGMIDLAHVCVSLGELGGQPHSMVALLHLRWIDP